jgi:hypothetical protein
VTYIKTYYVMVFRIITGGGGVGGGGGGGGGGGCGGGDCGLGKRCGLDASNLEHGPMCGSAISLRYFHYIAFPCIP